MNRNSTWFVKTISIACLLALVSAPGWCDRGKGPKKPGINHQSSEELTRYLQIEKVSIAKKSLENVTTTAGGRFAVTDNTIIIGMDGHQVSPREMPVPCDAEISYQTERDRKEAIYIKIKRIGRDASKLWTSEKAE